MMSEHDTYPEHQKARALVLPMRTLRSFMVWLQVRYPAAAVQDIDVEAALLEYYGIDQMALAEEKQLMQAGIRETQAGVHIPPEETED